MKAKGTNKLKENAEALCEPYGSVFYLHQNVVITADRVTVNMKLKIIKSSNPFVLSQKYVVKR